MGFEIFPEVSIIYIYQCYNKTNDNQFYAIDRGKRCFDFEEY